jgi:hypothetical protein
VPTRPDRPTRPTAARGARPLPLLTLLLLTAAVTGVEASDFRGLEWGASPAEVRAVEKYPIHHDLEHEIAYWNFELAGVPAGLVYTFEDGKLVSAHFLSRHRTTDPAADLADYQAFERHFDEHFGEHAGERWVWADGAEHDPSEQTLDAVTSGAAVRETWWELETNIATLRMGGGEGGIEYVRVGFEP